MYNSKSGKSLSDIEVILNVLGGKDQGESCFLLVLNKSNREVVFSLLVDSFAGIYDYLVTEKNVYGFKHLSCICWTHPHDDHTIDLEKILNDDSLVSPNKKCRLSKNGTTVVFPAFMEEELQQLSVSDEAVDIINESFHKCIKASDRPYNTKTLSWNLIKGNDMSLQFLTPTDVWERPYKGKRGINIHINNYNEMSLSFVLEIDNSFYIYFGGDCLDKQIEVISEEGKDRINKCNIVKIPHHGSDTSLKLLDLLGNNVEYAVTTSNLIDKNDTAKNLPKETAFNLYKEKIKSKDIDKVLCTKDFIKDGDKIGIVQYNIEFDSDNHSHTTIIKKSI